MALPPLYGCRSCAVHDAIVFCLWCDARLCLHCDAAVHAAAALHPRAPLCDACGAAPAALRCDGTVTLCAVCVGRGAPGVTRTGVATYTGCPGPAEMVRLVSADPPQPQQDFQTWLAHKLPPLVEEPPDWDAAMATKDHHHQLLPDWDVAMETAKLEKMLADSCTETAEPSSYGNGNGDDGNGLLCLSAEPAQMYTGADHIHDQMAQDAIAAIAMANKREARESAKQRYKGKKKNRRFGKQILYASRKAIADARKRVGGRFTKASASTSQHHDDDDDDHHDLSPDEHPTTATVNRETSS